MKHIFEYIFSACMFLYIGAGCQSDTQHYIFRGIYADDLAGPEGFYNPERGFRLDVALDVTSKNYVWVPDKYSDITSYLKEESVKYASDSISQHICEMTLINHGFSTLVWAMDT